MCNETIIVLCSIFSILLLGAVLLCVTMYYHIRRREKERDEVDRQQMFGLRVLLTEIIDIFDEGQEGKKGDRDNSRGRTDS